MTLDLFSIKGKTALVTGCKRGIGYGMALALAEGGANIVGVSATLEPSGSQIEQAVRQIGREFTGFQCDFSNRADLYQFIEQVKSRFPVIDILVNNAGTIRRQPSIDHSDEFWDTVVEVNQNAQFILSREFGKEMVLRRRGKIIFTASVLSFQGGYTVPGYVATKHAISPTIGL